MGKGLEDKKYKEKQKHLGLVGSRAEQAEEQHNGGCSSSEDSSEMCSMG